MNEEEMRARVTMMRAAAFAKAVQFAKRPGNLKAAGYTSLTNFVLSEATAVDKFMRDAERHIDYMKGKSNDNDH